MFKQFFFFVFGCIACVGCRNQSVTEKHQTPDYWNQNVYGDSLSAEPSHTDYQGMYALGMDYSPIELLEFLPYTILNDYWKTTHYLSFKDSDNHLLFEEYMHGDEVYSYPLIYASITDSRICLKKKLHTGMKRADVLRLLKLKDVDDRIQTICLTYGSDDSSTFYFADGLLKKIVLRTDRAILQNPDPVFEQRYAGQVRGYTGKRLYAVADHPNIGFSDVCYVDEQGDTIIPYGRYYYCESDSIAPVGFVFKKEMGILCINTEGQVMCRAYAVDILTPDYLSEGHFRIVNEEGLMGFADSLGHVVVTPQYKFALPFKGGKAKVTYTGHKSDPNDEHWEWVSDDWFYIDYQGNKLPVE